MIELLLGVGAAWVVAKMMGTAELRRQNFPLVPDAWWTPRDTLFRVKEQAYLRLRDQARLNALYRDYARAHPDHSLGDLLAALADANEGRWADGYERMKQLTAKEPQLSVGYWRLAVAAGELGRDGEAEQALVKFLELEPDSRMRPHVETWLTRLRGGKPGKAAPKAAKPKKGKRAQEAKPASAPGPADDKRARLEKLKARARKVRSG